MKTAPPAERDIDSRIEAAHRSVSRRLRRRRWGGRTITGLGFVAVLGLGGAGVATAFFPAPTVDIQGVVKTQYLDAFVACSVAAGVDTEPLLGADADAVLENWPGLDSVPYSAVVTRFDAGQQGEQGRVISACQASIAAEVGEPIF
jgi:hypothetical protein